ncbi:MAG: hypothetical protein R3C11_26670 [Planctomycetaceae bacterium]
MLLCGLLCSVGNMQNVIAKEKIYSDNRMISVEVLSLINRSRAGAPLPVDLKIYNNDKQLFTGELIIEASEQGSKFFTLRKQMTLVEGEQSTHLVLPLQLCQPVTGQVDLQLYFETDEYLFNLREHTVVAAYMGSCIFSVGCCIRDKNKFIMDTLVADQRAIVLEDWLTFKDIIPVQYVSEEGTAAGEPHFRTVFSDIEHQSIPEQALSLTCLDMLVLWPETLNELNNRQLEAIEQWVKAGGGLLIFSPPQLSSDHVAFLNRVGGDDGSQSLFFADLEQQLQWDEELTKGNPYLLNHHGLGRVAIIKQDLLEQQKAHQEALLNTYLFLWRVKKNVADVLLEKDAYQLEAEATERNQYYSRNYDFMQSQLSEEESEYTSEERIRQMMVNLYVENPPRRWLGQEVWLNNDTIWQKLLPDGFQVIPPYFIMSIMIGYLLLVGPGDYYILGKYFKRKWTWITFPVITLLFTYFTIESINAHMKIENPERKMIVTDIGDEGEVLKQTVCSCILSPSQMEKRETWNQQLVSPIDMSNGRFMANQFSSYRNSNQGLNTSTPTYEGSLTGEYDLVYNLQKWDPQIYVGFAIPEAEDSSNQERWQQHTEFWSQLSWDDLQDKNNLNKKAAQFFPAPFKLEIVTPPKSNYSTRSGSVPNTNFSRDLFDSLDRYRYSSEFQQFHSLAPRPGAFDNNQLIFDSTDPDERLVRIIWEENNSWHVERRLLRNEKPQ